MGEKKDLTSEELFIEAYQRTTPDQDELTRSKNFFIDSVNIQIIPVKDVIKDGNIFTIPDYLDIQFNKDSQSFFDAIMATGSLLSHIWLTPLNFLKKLIILDSIKDDNAFKSIAQAALNIRSKEISKKKEEQIPASYENFSKAIKFLTDTILVQHHLLQSRAFKPFVQLIYKIFVDTILIRNRNGDFQIVSDFIGNERTSYNTKNPKNDYQIYLKFVRTIIILYNDPRLPDKLFGTEIMKEAKDFNEPPFFNAYVDLLSSMVMTPELANKVYKEIEDSKFEILSFKNFMDAIFEHPDDLQNEKNRQPLAEKDAAGLEAVLRLLTSLFKQDLGILDRIGTNINFSADHPKDNILKYLSDKLIKFILLPVPATLKAECFNCLASLRVNLWTSLKVANILVYNKEETNNYKGIISDIIEIEAKANHFKLPQAVSNLIASMLENEESGRDSEKIDRENFVLYHDFLYEIVLHNLSKWTYSNDDMKWDILWNVCRAWINLLNRRDFLQLAAPLYRSAITDPDFIGDLIVLSNDEMCPIECLKEIYRLFLLLAWKENDFIKNSLSTNEPLLAGVVNKISSDSKSVIKMLKSFRSRFLNLQIVSMELIEFIASASPIIVQVLLSKPDVESIEICEALIKYNESEDTNDFFIEETERDAKGNYVKKFERDRNGQVITLNGRCFLLNILIQLGSASFFVRNVCGFDQHDPPKSILTTNLNSGILITIVKKLCEKETHVKYPIFVAKSIQVLLNECKHDLTINSTLNLLRSNLEPFFTTQLDFLALPNSSRIAIGCFLQIMALENANSLAQSNTSGLSRIVEESFNLLMLPLQNNNKPNLNLLKRNVLILDFIDRIINDENESNEILNGINDLTVAYLYNPNLIELMKENKQSWPSSWIQITFALLEKVKTLTNPKLTKKVVGTCALIANTIFIDKKFDNISPTDYDLKKLFALTLQVTSFLVEYDHTDSRIAAYGLLNTIASYIVCNDEIKAILQEKEKMILDSTLKDCKSEIPILRTICFSVIESLIPFATPRAFLPFLHQAIVTIEDHWKLFEFNENAAAFCLSSKCKMFSKFITNAFPDDSDDSDFFNPDLKVVIDEALIIKLSDNSFWDNLPKYMSDAVKNEGKLKTAVEILSLFSVISIAFNKSKDLNIQLNWFLQTFEDSFISLIDFGGEINLPLLNLYTSFVKLLSTMPRIDDLEKLNLMKIRVFFKKFAMEQEWRPRLQASNQMSSINNFNQAKKVVDQLLIYCAFVLMKVAENNDLFDKGKESDPVFPLSVLTSYLNKLIKEIIDDEAKIKNDIQNKSPKKTKKSKKSKKTDKKDVKKIVVDDDAEKNLDDNEEIKNEIQKKRSAASACLMLLWYHIDRWRHGISYIDKDIIKEQARAFSNEPYTNFTGSSPFDSVILKQFIDLASQ